MRGEDWRWAGCCAIVLCLALGAQAAASPSPESETQATTAKKKCKKGFKPVKKNGKTRCKRKAVAPVVAPVLAPVLPPAPAASLAITPSAWNFGSVAIGDNSQKMLTVTNSGPVASGALATAYGGTNAGDFSFAGNNCAGVSLAQNASCTLTVSFFPNGGGARSGTLTVSGTSGAPAVAPLSGTGS